MEECGHFAIVSIMFDVSDSISAVNNATNTTQQACAKLHLGLFMMTIMWSKFVD